MRDESLSCFLDERDAPVRLKSPYTSLNEQPNSNLARIRAATDSLWRGVRRFYSRGLGDGAKGEVRYGIGKPEARLRKFEHHWPMQPEYLARLSGPVQEFILEVEGQAHLGIEVILESRLNNVGPMERGNLEVDISARRIQIFAPSNGYFPDGAVRHEVLHVQRFHVDRVPKLALADGAYWDRDFRDGLARLDNAVEHLVIVPVELQFHPERRTHWEAVMSDVVFNLPSVPEAERRLAVCLHWTFLRHVLPGSPQIESARNFMNEHALAGEADAFADQLLSAAANKEEMVRILFLHFPEIPKYRAALEFMNSVTGTRQIPIP